MVSTPSELVSTELESKQLAEQALSKEDSKVLPIEEEKAVADLKELKPSVTEGITLTNKQQIIEEEKQLTTKQTVSVSQQEKVLRVSSEVGKTEESKKESCIGSSVERKDGSLQFATSSEQIKQESKEFTQLKENTGNTKVQQIESVPQKKATEQIVPATQTEIIEKNCHSTEIIKNGDRTENSPTVLTSVKQVENFHVAVEVNVDVDDMSRKYSGLSSSRG